MRITFNIYRLMIFVIIILFSIFTNPASSQTAGEWVEKGTAYDMSGEYEKAIEAYDRAIAINPNDKETWLIKGLALGELGEYDKAIEAYNKAIAIDPNYAYAWNHKGTALTELGEYEKAIESFNKAIAIDPNYGYAWITKGAAFGKLGEYDKAIEAYNKAIAIDPNDATAWTYKGTALTELGEYEKAIESFNKAISIDPGYGPAWYNKGIALTELGEYDKALEAYNKAIEAFDELLDFFPNSKEAKEMRELTRKKMKELTTKKMADQTSTSPISNQENDWIIISGIAIFIIIGIIVLRNRKNKSNNDKNPNNTDYKINKWNMFCQKCGAELKENAKFCQYCGAPFEQFSKILPIWKFILLSVITFGIYEIFWFYKNWKFLKEKNKLDISPFWRAFFSPLFAGSNAGHVLKLVKEINYPKQYSPTDIGISYFIISVLWRLPDPYWLISFFTFLPMIPIVKAMNFYWQNEKPDLPLKKFLWWQVILIIFGIILINLMLIGMFIPE